MMDLASLTVSGKVNKIIWANKNDPDSNDRKCIIKLDTQLRPGKKPVLVRFTTNQQPIPFLFKSDRIYPGFEMTVTGPLTSVTAPGQFTQDKTILHISNAIVCFEETLFYKRETIYTPTSAR